VKHVTGPPAHLANGFSSDPFALTRAFDREADFDGFAQWTQADVSDQLTSASELYAKHVRASLGIGRVLVLRGQESYH